MNIRGLHHVTLIAGSAQQSIDFYTGVLGLRLVKLTVNFDDPGSYHLYFGNAEAAPGSLITFFEWPGAARGAPGIGGTHHLALRVADRDGLLRWKRRLTDLGLRVRGPYDRSFFSSIYFRDPDGQILEIATDGPGWGEEAPDAPAVVLREEETWPEPVPVITPEMALSQGLHHLSAISGDLERTHAFLGELLGLRLVKQTVNTEDPAMRHWFWGDETGRVGSLVSYFEWEPGRRRARLGRGQTHHYALTVDDDEAQQAWRERLLEAGWPVSPVRDRVYFKSIYTRDPDGHIVELATAGPGFTVDEPLEALGTTLRLPPWLEEKRSEIIAALPPLTVPSATAG